MIIDTVLYASRDGMVRQNNLCLLAAAFPSSLRLDVCALRGSGNMGQG